MSNTRQRIRIEGDMSSPYPMRMIDKNTRQTPKFARARAFRVDLGLRDQGIWQSNISQFTSLTLEIIDAATITGARIIDETVAAASFNEISEAEWDSGDKAHVTFNIDAGDTALFTPSSFTSPQSLWLVVTGLTAAGNVTVLAGNALAIEDGGVYAGAADPDPSLPQFPTVEQVQAMIAGAFAPAILTSPNGTKQWILGVTDDGERIDRAK